MLVGGSPPGAWLLDVDSCRAATPASHAANLRRFYRSWDKWNRTGRGRLTDGDRRDFEAGYSKASR